MHSFVVSVIIVSISCFKHFVCYSKANCLSKVNYRHVCVWAYTFCCGYIAVRLFKKLFGTIYLVRHRSKERKKPKNSFFKFFFFIVPPRSLSFGNQACTYFLKVIIYTIKRYEVKPCSLEGLLADPPYTLQMFSFSPRMSSEATYLNWCLMQQQISIVCTGSYPRQAGLCLYQSVNSYSQYFFET